MHNKVNYRHEFHAEDDLYSLYEALGWNKYLKLTQNQVNMAIRQSFAVVHAYINNNLVGTGRVISDGVINAYLCGLGVLPEFRGHGIGTSITKMLISHCEENKLHIQILCEEGLIPYYTKIGFAKFAVGMKF